MVEQAVAADRIVRHQKRVVGIQRIAVEERKDLVCQRWERQKHEEEAPPNSQLLDRRFTLLFSVRVRGELIDRL